MSFDIRDKWRISDSSSAVTTGAEYQTVEMLDIRKTSEFQVYKSLAINQEWNIRWMKFRETQNIRE
jgi:uncharacterized protein YjaG (DUF416 family)